MQCGDSGNPSLIQRRSASGMCPSPRRVLLLFGLGTTHPNAEEPFLGSGGRGPSSWAAKGFSRGETRALSAPLSPRAAPGRPLRGPHRAPCIVRA